MEDKLQGYWGQFLPVTLLAAIRLTTLIAWPQEALQGYGDFVHFFHLAALPGWPFLQYWAEFPPVFPFVSAILFRIASGQEHVYDTLLWMILTAADIGNLFLFIKINQKFNHGQDAPTRVWFYFAILAGLSYCWWYFDSLAVFWLLLSIYFLIGQKDIPTGISIAVGTLTKLFPALVLILVWKYRPVRTAILTTVVSIGVCVLVYAGLYFKSPQMTAASLASQSSKGTWETVWALVDGNLRTGNFGPEIDRLDPAKAYLLHGNPPQVSSVLILTVLGFLGLVALLAVKKQSPLVDLSWFGFAWVLLILGSPGWSPQWILYIIPIILLTLPMRQATLMVPVFILANLLEWPVLLSRGLFTSLWLTIPLRALLLILMGSVWFQQLVQKKPVLPVRILES